MSALLFLAGFALGWLVERLLRRRPALILKR